MAPKSISERDLQQAVRRLFHNHQYILVNTYVFNWESDLFSVTKSGNVYEVEMKIYQLTVNNIEFKDICEPNQTGPEGQ